MSDAQKKILREAKAAYEIVVEQAQIVVTGIGRIQRSAESGGKWPFGQNVKIVNDAFLATADNEGKGAGKIAQWARNEE